jgi:membrane associated rhomboid family serine protease
MGIYDREYVREEPRGFNLGGDTTMVTKLIVVNVVIFLADLFAGGAISNALAVRPNVLGDPRHWWQLLTYGFVHDPRSIMHVGVNMLVLWMFGRDVEIRYGRAEFLRIYLALVVLSGIGWAIVENVHYGGAGPGMFGASGAISGIVMLCVLLDPHRTVLFFGVVPMPMWLLGAIFVLQDLFGLRRSTPFGEVHIAYGAHLAGAFFGYLYFKSGIHFGRFVPSRFSWSMFKPRPKLRVHDPNAAEPSLDRKVDEILRKIQAEGSDSLTPAERRTMEEASRRYQRRRQS